MACFPPHLSVSTLISDQWYTREKHLEENKNFIIEAFNSSLFDLFETCIPVEVLNQYEGPPKLDMPKWSSEVQRTLNMEDSTFILKLQYSNPVLVKHNKASEKPSNLHISSHWKRRKKCGDQHSLDWDLNSEVA